MGSEMLPYPWMHKEEEEHQYINLDKHVHANSNGGRDEPLQGTWANSGAEINWTSPGVFPRVLHQ